MDVALRCPVIPSETTWYRSVSMTSVMGSSRQNGSHGSTGASLTKIFNLLAAASLSAQESMEHHAEVIGDELCLINSFRLAHPPSGSL